LLVGNNCGLVTALRALRFKSTHPIGVALEKCRRRQLAGDCILWWFGHKCGCVQRPYQRRTSLAHGAPRAFGMYAEAHRGVQCMCPVRRETHKALISLSLAARQIARE